LAGGRGVKAGKAAGGPGRDALSSSASSDAAPEAPAAVVVLAPPRKPVYAECGTQTAVTGVTLSRLNRSAVPA
jgi:hypothetical protein